MLDYLSGPHFIHPLAPQEPEMSFGHPRTGVTPLCIEVTEPTPYTSLAICQNNGRILDPKTASDSSGLELPNIMQNFT